MSSGGPECPECEIIIITYAQIPARCDDSIHYCESIEALYGTDYVKARIQADPHLHAQVMAKHQKVLERELKNNEDLLEIIRLLAPGS
jgi:hypothetical protein